MKTMFKSKLDKQTLQKVNQDLINGGSLEKVAKQNNLSYQNVCYYRKKLVKAGILSPLYTTRRKKRVAKATFNQRNLFMQPTVVKTVANKPFTLVVNDTTIDITGSKHVNVTPDKVYIKY